MKLALRMRVGILSHSEINSSQKEIYYETCFKKSTICLYQSVTDL